MQYGIGQTVVSRCKH